MAVAKAEAPRSPRPCFQLPHGIVGWQREVADEDEVRRRAGRCAMQRYWDLATKSPCALDHHGGRRERVKRGAGPIVVARCKSVEARRTTHLLRLYPGKGRNQQGGSG